MFSGMQRIGDAWGQLLDCMPQRANSHQDAQVPVQFHCIFLHCILTAHSFEWATNWTGSQKSSATTTFWKCTAANSWYCGSILVFFGHMQPLHLPCGPLLFRNLKYTYTFSTGKLIWAIPSSSIPLQVLQSPVPNLWKDLGLHLEKCTASWHKLLRLASSGTPQSPFCFMKG